MPSPSSRSDAAVLEQRSKGRHIYVYLYSYMDYNGQSCLCAHIVYTVIVFNFEINRHVYE